MMIRKATEDDFDAIMGIYAYAREFMKRTGNPTQWGDTHPPESAVRDDIATGKGFVVEEGGNVCGVFHFYIGEDPTYRVIEGQWKNNDRYGTVHRVASNGTVRGVLRQCLAFCEQQVPNVRIDTHHDNAVMRHLLEKLGYERCGIIHVEDRSPRIAYQKVVRPTSST